ncbi:hypothetical protein ACFSTE_05955 [Aquimarina hainanensis]|uniref:DUF2019 domain-containing protein n=1 Tax=Aquimarina hainanensis TaxID=1578017 RepID=A0ABW5N578_9FLAO
MNFQNIKEAVIAYIEGFKASKQASDKGDFKTNNSIMINQVNPAFDYLKGNNELIRLVKFLESEEYDVKQSIAVALLPYYEEIAIAVLEDISKMNVPLNSFKAKIVLKKWRESKTI